MERIEKPSQPQQAEERSEVPQGLIRKWGKILAFVSISGGGVLLGEHASHIASLLEQYREGLAQKYEQVALEKKDIADAWHHVHRTVVTADHEYTQSKKVSPELRKQFSSALSMLAEIQRIHPNTAKWDTVEPTDAEQYPPVRYYFGEISYRDKIVPLEVPALKDEDPQWKTFLQMWEEISRERTIHFKKQYKEIEHTVREMKS